MGTFFLILIGISLCSCAVAAASADEEKKKATAMAAKRPEALAFILKEEFPAYAELFTYARCERALASYLAASQKGKGIAGLSALLAGTADSAETRRYRQALLLSIAHGFSPQFHAHAAADLPDYLRKMEMSMKSSETKAAL